MKSTINKYFEVKVKMQKTQEDGTQKKVTEQYVVEAATFGEAERRITECLKPYIEGEFDVTDIKIAGYSQIVGGDENADKYFKAKVTFVALDETTGKEKKTSELYLVQSETLESAESDVKNYLNDSNTTISSIAETVILDVFTLN
ncbi:MAG: DUF4494 domain-containing protein [Prevotella sp.]|nr:DUF4494 domain-containing protein [Prevotella sp.]